MIKSEHHEHMQHGKSVESILHESAVRHLSLNFVYDTSRIFVNDSAHAGGIPHGKLYVDLLLATIHFIGKIIEGLPADLWSTYTTFRFVRTCVLFVIK